MLPEHQLVPYSTCDLPPGPWLVFAPHADDETFGMGGSLLAAADQHISTHVVVLTDGALGGHNEPDLVTLRRREVEAACRQLGVKSLQTWDQPDRGLQVDSALIERVIGNISETCAATVFFPGLLELHPDHRMTTQLIWSAQQQLRQRPWRGCMPQLWAYEISVQSPINRLIDVTVQMAAKHQAMLEYASQNSQNNYIDLVLSLNKARTFSLPPDVSHAEGYYCFSDAQAQLSLRDAALQILSRYFETAQTQG